MVLNFSGVDQFTLLHNGSRWYTLIPQVGSKLMLLKKRLPLVSILNNQTQSKCIRNKELHYEATGKQNRSKKYGGPHCCCSNFGYLKNCIFLTVMLACMDWTVSVSEKAPEIAGVETNEAQ